MSETTPKPLFPVATCGRGFSLLAALRRPIHRSRSNITTLRSLSALMIFLFGALSPVSTMLIIEGATPFFLAHSFWPPARFTSERSKRTTSFWSSARMSALGRSPQLAAAGNRFVGPRDKRPEMTSEPLFRVTETANPSSHPRICAENSDCSPTTGNIQLA
jgi:hypothetical protein